MLLSKAYLRNALNSGVSFSICPAGRSRSGLRGCLGSSCDLARSCSMLSLVRGPNVSASGSFNAAMAPSRSVNNSFSFSVASSSSASAASFRLRNVGRRPGLNGGCLNNNSSLTSRLSASSTLVEGAARSMLQTSSLCSLSAPRFPINFGASWCWVEESAFCGARNKSCAGRLLSFSFDTS